MRCKSNVFAPFADWKWHDRVDDGAHDKFDALPLEQIVGQAIEFAQTIIDRAIEPMIDALDGLTREFHRDAHTNPDGQADTADTSETAAAAH